MEKQQQNFFEAWFALCSEYAAVHQLLDKKARGRLDASEGNEQWTRHQELIKRDAAFWQETAESDAARRFAAYAEHFAFDRFAQRVLLYLFYFEFANTEKPEMTPKLLAELFGGSGELTQRIRLVRQFTRQGALLQSGALRGEDERARRSYRPGSREELTLSAQHAGYLTQLIDGETLAFAERQEEATPAEQEDEEVPERVGLVLAPAVTLDDVVLEPVARERLELFLDQFRDNTLDKLGVTQHIRHSKGLTLLFYGPPGTGKSMLAEAVAAHLGREVLHVEVPKIMSRWVGETDKQIARAFAAAQQRNLVLLFDEADSLLTRREMLYQDHDIRFVNDMLAAIEKYPGVVVLTTNMETLMDAAIERRVDMKIRFEQPPAELRAEIWHRTVPASVTASDDIDYVRLARDFEYSGGYIRNAVLTAIRHMAGAKRTVLNMEDMLFGAEFERDGLFVKDSRKVRVAGFAAAAPVPATEPSARREITAVRRAVPAARRNDSAARRSDSAVRRPRQ